MRCLLHIGTEKTGSSYLQCILALARDSLLHSGVWFPVGAPFDEKCMKSGRISGGNALKIAEEIERDDWDSVAKRLATAKKEASNHGSTDVLLSSELLLQPLSFENRLSRLLNILRDLGFASAALLVILRDPTEQLLSLYKHRAKGGKAGRIQQWVENGYTLPNDLKALRAQAEAVKITLNVRGYTRRPGGLDELFFKDWLGLSVLPNTKTSEVNPSLALSELELLRELNTRRPELVPFLYEQLVTVAPQEKIDGSALKAHAQAVAENAVWRHRQEWQAWNHLMPKGEQLVIPPQAPEIPDWPEELGFSTRQIEQLAAFMAETARFTFLARLIWRSRLRPFLGRIKRLVVR